MQERCLMRNKLYSTRNDKKQEQVRYRFLGWIWCHQWYQRMHNEVNILSTHFLGRNPPIFQQGNLGEKSSLEWSRIEKWYYIMITYSILWSWTGIRIRGKFCIAMKYAWMSMHVFLLSHFYNLSVRRDFTLHMQTNLQLKSYNTHIHLTIRRV